MVLIIVRGVQPHCVLGAVSRALHLGHLGGSAVEHLPLAQGMIPVQGLSPTSGSPPEPASPSARVSASLSGSLMNK